MTTTDPLVSTEWLAARLAQADVKVVDATFKMPGVLPLPKDDYLASHIPGAVFFDVDAVSDHSNPLPHMSIQNATRSLMVARNRASRKRASRVEGLQNRKRAVSATSPSRAWRSSRAALRKGA